MQIDTDFGNDTDTRFDTETDADIDSDVTLGVKSAPRGLQLPLRPRPRLHGTLRFLRCIGSTRTDASTP